jgi:hypothetical protein
MLNMSMKQLGRRGIDKEVLMHLLTLSAFFDKQDICDILFMQHFKVANPEWMKDFAIRSTWDKFKFHDALAEFNTLSFLQSLIKEEHVLYFSIHPLMQDWAKLRLDDEDRQKYTGEAITVLGSFIKAQESTQIPLKLKQALILHLDACVKTMQNF